MPTIRLEIPALPPPELRGNRRQRTHWAVLRRVVRDWLWLVRQALEPGWSHLPHQPWPRAEADVVFVVPDHKRRDEDNFRIGLKELWDYLVDPVKLLPEDYSEVFTVKSVRFEVDKERAPRTIITLRRRER